MIRELTDASCRITSIGCLTIMMALAIDPFTQQIVSYPSRPVDTPNNSTLPRTVYYSDAEQGGESHQNPTWMVDSRLKSSIYTGLYSNAAPDVPITCSTGNCTWGIYQSLAICSECTDITGDIQKMCTSPTENDCAVTLPNNLSIVAGAIAFNPTVNVSSHIDRTINYRDYHFAFAAFSALATPSGLRNSGTYSNARAVECVLYWCVKTYTSSTNGSDFTETLITSDTNQNLLAWVPPISENPHTYV